MRAVQNGWVPCTALARGLVAVQEQDPRELLLAGHCELDSDTEAEAESGDPDLDGLDASDADTVQSDALSVASEPEGDVLDYQGPWILKTWQQVGSIAVHSARVPIAAACCSMTAVSSAKPAGHQASFEIMTKYDCCILA